MAPEIINPNSKTQGFTCNRGFKTRVSCYLILIKITINEIVCETMTNIVPYFENFSECFVDFCNLEYFARPRGYKTFFMLNSTAYELSTAHKN